MGRKQKAVRSKEVNKYQMIYKVYISIMAHWEFLNEKLGADVVKYIIQPMLMPSQEDITEVKSNMFSALRCYCQVITFHDENISPSYLKGIISPSYIKACERSDREWDKRNRSKQI